MPPKVFDEIPASEVPAYSGSYVEALYDKQGRMITLKHFSSGHHQYATAEYTYHSNGSVHTQTEVLIEDGMVITTWYSPKGKFMRRQRNILSEDTDTTK